MVQETQESIESESTKSGKKKKERGGGTMRHWVEREVKRGAGRLSRALHAQRPDGIK